MGKGQQVERPAALAGVWREASLLGAGGHLASIRRSGWLPSKLQYLLVGRGVHCTGNFSWSQCYSVEGLSVSQIFGYLKYPRYRVFSLAKHDKKQRFGTR